MGSTIGERLRSAREAAGLGVRELARAAGFPSSHGDVSKIEQGLQPRPAGPKIAAYAKVLGVSTDWLMTGEGRRERREDEAPEASEDLSPYDAARAMFLAQERHDGRGDEARAFIEERQVHFAGAERKSPRWWVETLTEEFREWRETKGEALPKVNARRPR